MIAPSWAETALALQEAQNPEQLWIVLLSPHGIRGSSAWEEPYLLFRRFHLDEPTDAATTALLLCTDHRWRKATHHLIHELEDTGLLDEPALDQLAAWFVAADLEVSLPRHLLAGAPVVFTPSRSEDATLTVELPRTSQAHARSGRRRDLRRVSVRRSVWPPLRRWAAARLLRSATASWRDVVHLAADLPSRDAAMTLAGVMDAADTLPEVDRAAVIEIGLTSRSGIVRLAALPALAGLEGPEAAKERAATDPAEKVRAWAKKPAAPTRLALGEPADADGGDEPADTEPSPPSDIDQPSLF